MKTTKPVERFSNEKAFLDACAQLRYVAIYPVQWGEDPAIYRTQLKGTQAQGFTCVHCDALPRDEEAMVPIGRVLDTAGCAQIFAHTTCTKGDH